MTETTASPMTAPPSGAPSRRGVAWLWLVALTALAGAWLAGVSTRDFVAHLDGQVHAIHCSVLPGDTPVLGASGCQAALMSPYSSFFRGWLWGGVPVSLLGLAVFAWIAIRAAHLALSKDVSRRQVLFLLLATLVPVGASAVWGTLAVTRLGEVCTVCAGMYATSGLGFVFALVAFLRARPGDGTPFPIRSWALGSAEGLAYVLVLVFAYAAFSPEGRRGAEGCGTLVDREDPSGSRLPFSGPDGGVPSIALLDPLCPACRAFDERLRASGLMDRMKIEVLLFPLDAKCNWMTKSSVHPGACLVSEALLCAPSRTAEILAHSFAHQEEWTALGKSDEPALARALETAFPEVKGCLGSASVKHKLNKGLRWAVANALPVLTPQLIVGDRRLCDEDTDLGLEFTLAAMLDAVSSPTTAAAAERR